MLNFSCTFRFSFFTLCNVFLGSLAMWKTCYFLHQNNYNYNKPIEICLVFRVFDFIIRTKIKNSEIWKFSTYSSKTRSLEFTYLGKTSEFSEFRFQYKDQNRKLGNLGNSQLPQIKQILWNLRLENISEFSEFSILV